MTYKLIASNTVGSGGAASITFSSIPQDYTDLAIRISCRTNGTSTGDGFVIALNGSSASFTGKGLFGDSASARSNTTTTAGIGVVAGTSQAANIFAATDVYINDYSTSNFKPFLIQNANDSNSTLQAYVVQGGRLWSNTAAITSFTLTTDNSASFIQYTSVHLYGIKNS